MFIHRLPDCRQDMTLAPQAARLLKPGSGAVGLETFWLSSLPQCECVAERASVAERARADAVREAGPLAR